MASIIRIKRSSVSGNPATLAAGELAYSALSDNGSNGGDRLYIGIGTETSGNAANHIIIGGKRYTDMVDAATDANTANTLVKRDASGNITVGTITGTFSGNASSATKWATARDLSLTGDGTATLSAVDGTGNVSAALTLATVNSNTGSFGSSTAIPVITVNGKGLITAVSTASITTSLSISGDTGTDTIALATDTLGFVGGTGITSTVSSAGNTVTFDIDSTVATLTGTQTLTNKTLTLPTIGGTGATFNGSTSGTTVVKATAAAGTTTLTLPAATDTLVGKATTDTFTNKSISFGSNTITMTSAQLATAVSDETGSGLVVFNNSPTLVTPVLGVASATTINKVAITTPATGSTLTIADGKTLTASNTLTFTGTDAASVNFAAGGTVAYTGTPLSQFASTTSSQLAGVISDETGSGSLVFSDSPTLVTPTLGAALATSVTATSGNLTVAAASGNNSVSIVPTGTGTVDVNSKRISSVADPVQSQDAATKAYVDAVKTGLDVKDSVRAATTANITLSAPQTIDGVSVIAGDRVLVKDQSTGSQNGIYVVAAGSWTRSLDCDNTPGTEVTSGLFTFVEEGTTNADSGWILTTNGTITVGTTALTFVQFSGAGQITAGNGLTKTGNTIDAVGTSNRITVTADAIDIASTYVGQNTITTLGTVTTGTWNATVLAGQYGGTGVNNNGKTITLGGNLTTSGAYASTFTMTAATSVTFPTTGTLATLAGSEALSNKTITASSFSGTTIAGSGLATFTNTTDASAVGTAAVVLSGGLSVAKAMYIGTNITGAGAATSTLDGFNIDGGTY